MSSCDDTVTTVESDTFKYFRTQFSTVANNRISVEVRDIEGKLLGKFRDHNSIFILIDS